MGPRNDISLCDTDILEMAFYKRIEFLFGPRQDLTFKVTGNAFKIRFRGVGDIGVHEPVEAAQDVQQMHLGVKLFGHGDHIGRYDRGHVG